MANINPVRFKRYTVNLVNVGVGGYTTGTFVPAYLTGKVIEVTAKKTAGVGATVTLQLKENAARPMLDTGAQVAFPLEKYELAREYDITAQQSVQVGAKVDQGADTNITIEIVVEG